MRKLIITIVNLLTIISINAQYIQFENNCKDGTVLSNVIIWGKDNVDSKTFKVLSPGEKYKVTVNSNNWYVVLFYNTDNCGNQLENGKNNKGDLKIYNPYKDGPTKYYRQDTMYWKPSGYQQFYKINDYCWENYKA